MKYRIYTVFAMLFMVINSYGQYDWTPAKIHLESGETLTGEVRLSKQGIPSIIPAKDRAFYRKTEDAKIQKLYPSKIDRIVFTITFEVEEDGEKISKTRKAIYISTYLKKRKKRKRFVELIMDGKVKFIGRTVRISGSSGVTPIFSHQGIAHMHYNYFGSFVHNELYVWRNDELPKDLMQGSGFSSFKTRASKYFKDCESLIKKIKDKTYKSENLLEIVKHYNENCN